VKQEIVTPARD